MRRDPAREDGPDATTLNAAVTPRLTLAALVITYQQEAFVEEAIRSVLHQLQPVDDIILVDDGSTDRTVELAQRVGGDRLRCLRLPHRGIGALAETYNAGLRHATTDLVSILEGDDRWLPTKAAAHRRAFADPDVVLAHGPYAVIGARGTSLRPRVDPPVHLAQGRYDAFPSHLLASYIMGVTVTLRRSAALAIGGFAQLGGTPHIDYPTYLALAQLGPFHYDDRVHTEWRKHGQSGTTRLAGVDLAGAAMCRALALEVRASSERSDLPSERTITRSWEAAQGRQIWNAARLLLKAGRHAEARTLLRGTPTSRHPNGLRLRLMAARVAALLRTDVEPLARLWGGASVFDDLD